MVAEFRIRDARKWVPNGNFRWRDANAQVVATQFGAYTALVAVILSVYFE